MKNFNYLFKYKYLYCLISIKKYFNSFYIGVFKCINGYIFCNKLMNGCFLGDFFKNIYLPIKLLSYRNLIGSYNILKNLTIYCIITNLFLNKNNFQIARSSGTYCQILEFKDFLNLVLIKMPSGLKKYINSLSYCIIGRNSNINHKYEIYSKASFCYNINKWPRVRGVAKNPVDHPHGGRTKTNKPEVSPWGWVTKYSH